MHFTFTLVSICTLVYGGVVVATPIAGGESKLEARAPQLVCQVATAGNPNWSDAVCSARVKKLSA